MYTLYYSPGAASLAVHWMLIEVGARHELVKIDFETKAQKSADYLKLNPNGVVPTLLIDGQPRAETGALLMLLAERHPEARLAPAPGAPERADFLQWMFHLANVVQPSFRMWFYSHEGAGPEQEEATKAEARKRIEAAWDRVDAHLADRRRYFLGDELSAVDFLATMLMRWSRNMPKPASEWASISRYLSTMRAMPSLIETHKREGLNDWIGG
ncbi:MAG: glutathione S-transferase family protein [Amphiplicatus sp.]